MKFEVDELPRCLAPDDKSQMFGLTNFQCLQKSPPAVTTREQHPHASSPLPQARVSDWVETELAAVVTGREDLQAG